MNPTQDPKPQPGRPRWEVITELKSFANKGSTAFWEWYWGLNEADRKTARAG